MGGDGLPEWTAHQLAEKLGGELIGGGDVVLRRVDTLDDADEGSLTFVRDARHFDALRTTKASAALLPRVLAPRVNGEADRLSLIVVPDTDLALIALLDEVAPKPVRPTAGVHPTAVGDAAATIAAPAAGGPQVSIGAGTTVGDGVVLHPGVRLGAGVAIGDGAELHSGVVIRDSCRIGRAVIIHANVVIGTDGFGYRPAPDGRGVVKVPHVGNVVVEDGVEIGANTTIDRGKLGSTRIGAGTKIDNLVQIGHNCIIGRNCIICGCCGLSGSVWLGDGVTLAGGVGIADGVVIGDGATIGGRSGVGRDVPAGETWLGYPARPGRKTMKMILAMERLPSVLAGLGRLSSGTEQHGKGVAEPGRE